MTSDVVCSSFFCRGYNCLPYRLTTKTHCPPATHTPYILSESHVREILNSTREKSARKETVHLVHTRCTTGDNPSSLSLSRRFLFLKALNCVFSMPIERVVECAVVCKKKRWMGRVWRRKRRKAGGDISLVSLPFPFSLSLSLSLSHCLSVRSIAEMADNGGEAALPKKILKKQASDGGYIKVALQARLEAKRGKEGGNASRPADCHTHTHIHTHAHTRTHTHTHTCFCRCGCLPAAAGVWSSLSLWGCGETRRVGEGVLTAFRLCGPLGADTHTHTHTCALHRHSGHAHGRSRRR